MYQTAKAADTASAKTVVAALHRMPKPSNPRKIRSRSALRMEEKARNFRGVLASPTLFREPPTPSVSTLSADTPPLCRRE